jgi:hypothetical protein
MMKNHPSPSSIHNPLSSCDRRLSRAAREIVRVYLSAALLLEVDDDDDDEDPRRRRRRDDPGDESWRLLANDVVSDWNLWQLLDVVTLQPPSPSTTMTTTVTTNGNANAEECPFVLPDRYRRDEEQSIPVMSSSSSSTIVPRKLRAAAIPGYLSLARRKRKNNNKTKNHGEFLSFHQCGICHKLFTSKYYLDQHFQQIHTTMSDHDATRTTKMICPADWCQQFIPWHECHDVALTMEPYYGPGGGNNNNNDDDQYRIRSQLVRQAHARPCTGADLERTQRACQRMLHTCFGPDTHHDTSSSGTTTTTSASLAHHLLETLCAPRSCHSRIHDLLVFRMMGSSSSSSILHHHPNQQWWWKDAWMGTMQQHEQFSGIGILVLILILCFYIQRAVQSTGWSQQQQQPPDTPTHQHTHTTTSTSTTPIHQQSRKKESHHTFLSSSSAPTTFIGTKSKQQ